jgi:hypothetical protein
MTLQHAREVPFWRGMAEVPMAFGVRVMARP